VGVDRTGGFDFLKAVLFGTREVCASTPKKNILLLDYTECTEWYMYFFKCPGILGGLPIIIFHDANSPRDSGSAGFSFEGM
jgi:hypothetical protein